MIIEINTVCTDLPMKKPRIESKVAAVGVNILSVFIWEYTWFSTRTTDYRCNAFNAVSAADCLKTNINVYTCYFDISFFFPCPFSDARSLWWLFCCTIPNYSLIYLRAYPFILLLNSWYQFCCLYLIAMVLPCRKRYSIYCNLLLTNSVIINNSFQ